MSEVLTVELIEQWNEENPEDCHSPWMGILDEQVVEATPVVEQPVVDYVKSPATGESGAPILLMCVMLLLSLQLMLTKGRKHE